MLSSLLGFLLPNHCLFCDQTVSGSLALCDDCTFDLPYISPEHQCPRCGIAQSSAHHECNDCLFNPPAFCRSYIPFEYRPPINAAVIQLKYRSQLSAAPVLAHLLLQHIHAQETLDDWQAPDYLLAVPMHWARRWQRGFNHTNLITRQLSNRLHIPDASHWLSRQPSAELQKALNRQEREAHLRGAFRIKPRASLQQKHIALIDDVVTTTATARELSQTLMDAGAASVQLWAIARTPAPNPADK